MSYAFSQMHENADGAMASLLAGPVQARAKPPPPQLSEAEQAEARSHCGLLADGVEIPCDLRVVEHPEGRFRREDGSRYDICVMEVLTQPNLRAPAVSRAEFVGDCADNQPAVIRLGNVRPSSFRPRLISPGEAFGTLAAAAKSTGDVSG